MDGLRIGAAIAAAVCMSGCVGRLETLPYRERTDLNQALPGTTYALPKLRYDVKLTRVLAECPGEMNDGKPTALKFAISADAKPAYVAGEAYSVDHTKLPGWLRTGTYEIKWYESGILKSIGAGAEDRTAQVISNVAKTASSMASALALGAGPEAGAPRVGALVQCTQAAKDALKRSNEIDGELKGKLATIERLEKNAEKLKLAAAARLVGDLGRDRFMTIFDQLDAEEQAVAKLKKEQEGLNKVLGVSDDIPWEGGVTAPEEQTLHALSVDQVAKLKGLFFAGPVDPTFPMAADKGEAVRRRITPSCFAGGENAVEQCLRQQLDLRSGVYLERDLKRCGTLGATPEECWSPPAAGDRRVRDARDEVPDSGIFVREPMTGRLLFCRVAVIDGAEAQSNAAQAEEARVQAVANAQANGAGNPAAGRGQPGDFEGGPLRGNGTNAPVVTAAVPEFNCNPGRDETKIPAANFPQYGQLRYLELRVGTFQARELALSMTESGRMESFSYKSTKAAGEGLTGAMADAASQASGFVEARETERRDDLKYEEERKAAKRKETIAELTDMAAIKALTNPPEVDPLKPAKDETAAILVEVGLLKARNELSELVALSAGRN